MKRSPVIAAVLVVALAAGGYGLYQLGLHRGMRQRAPTSPSTASSVATPAVVAQESGEDATRRHLREGLKAGDIDPTNGKKILYYHDPMVPGQRFDKPGKSPFMDMMMSPVYADSGGSGDDGGVTISPRIQQSIGLRTAEATEAPWSANVSAVGSVAYNERELAVVQARATGYVEKLYVRATLDPVRAGQPLAELYVPDWVAAQEEFLAVRRMQGADLGPLLDGARQRMRQAGMSPAQIQLVEATARTHPRLTITAPVGGVVSELDAREGMTVMPGATLFRINGLSTVWVDAEVPESQIALLRPGSQVQATTPALPGMRFDGRVQALLPQVNPATRTLTARMELRNREQQLVPGMFVTMQLATPANHPALTVPSDAVIQAGRRALVMLAEGDGHFRPQEVRIGAERGGRTEILQGLHAGQKVVLSAQFLVDSEASLRGIEDRLDAANAALITPASAPAMAASGSTAVHHASGKIESITADEVTLSHSAVPELNWPPMTMGFKPPRGGLPSGLAAGQQVQFEFSVYDSDGARLLRITPSASGSQP